MPLALRYSNTSQEKGRRMTTHRVLQLSNLLDTMTSRAGVCRRGAENLRRIGNDKGAAHQDERAARFERIANRAAALLAKDKNERELMEAAQVWDDLASSEEKLATWEEEHGLPMGCTNITKRHNVSVYRRTAKALRIQAELQEPVCNLCLKPYGHGTQYDALQRHVCAA